MKYFFHVILLIVLFCPLSGTGEERKDISQAVLSVKKDIEKKTRELIDIRARVSEERMPFLQNFRKLEKEVLELRKNVRLLRAAEIRKKHDAVKLENEAGYFKQETEFVFTLLQEYRRETERRMTNAEVQLYKKTFEEIDGVLESIDRLVSLSAVKPLMQLAFQRNRDNIGGRTFPGDCLDDTGLLMKGDFVLTGPVSYFVSKDSKTAGLAGTALNSMIPRIEKKIEPVFIRTIADAGDAYLPFDVTLGNAQKTVKLRKSWLQHIRTGGVIMFPILGLGLICVIVAFWKVVSLSRIRIMKDKDLDRIISLVHSGQIEEAMEKASLLGHPSGPVILEGIRHNADPREYMEDVMHEKVLSEIPFLQKGLPVLAVAAAAAPLLGLLGTVTGMIHTFDLITLFGTGKAGLLSAGISEALVTTEYGLIIAVPALITHAYLSRRVKLIIHSLDKASLSFINGLKVRKGK